MGHAVSDSKQNGMAANVAPLASRKTILVMSDKIVFQYIYILFNQKLFLVGYGWSGIHPSTNMEGNVGLARGVKDR